MGNTKEKNRATCINLQKQQREDLTFLKRHTICETNSEIVRRVITEWAILIQKAQEWPIDLRRLRVSGYTQDGKEITISDLNLLL